jgi:hypothetical protein
MDKTECMLNIYSISRRMWKWTKKATFSSSGTFTSCGSKLSQRHFRLDRQNTRTGRVPQPHIKPQGKHTPSASQLAQLDA